jgi:TonB family protein
MLNRGPWPKNANGQYAEGRASVLLSVNYHGIPVAACIEQSTGNAALDVEAIRRAIAPGKFSPELKNGSPANSYARFPVEFSLTGNPVASVDSQAALTKECEPQPIPGVSLNELALSRQPKFTILRTPYGQIPDTNEEWPSEADGKPVNMDGFIWVLIDSTGQMMSTQPLNPNRFDQFGRAVSKKLAAMTFPRSDEKHWEIVKFQFRVD